jgi:hypothetical protein
MEFKFASALVNDSTGTVQYLDRSMIVWRRDALYIDKILLYQLTI